MMEARSLLLVLCVAACLSILQGGTDSVRLTSFDCINFANDNNESLALQYFEHHNAIEII